jgi:phosphate transport system protein
MQGHIYKPFDRELSDLKENLLFLGELVEKAINRAIISLGERDSELAAAVIADDDKVDNQELKIDELCLKILALRQPAARDLRFIITAIKVNYDLERIGDMAVNICERVQELNVEPQLKPYLLMPQLADIVQQMLKQCLSSFVNANPDLARQVIRHDEEVDKLNDQIFHELLDYMTRDFNTVTRSTRLLFISRYLERIADHAVNIAEMVIFMAEGKIVRHLRDSKGE